MSDDEGMGNRWHSATRAYVRSPITYDTQYFNNDTDIPAEEPAPLIEDVEGGEPVENSVADAFNLEANTASDATSYLPTLDAPSSEPLTSSNSPHGTHKVVRKVHHITLKMVSTDHIWCVRQDRGKRIELKVFGSIEALQGENDCAEAIRRIAQRQNQLFVAQRQRDLWADKSSKSSRSSKSTDRGAKDKLEVTAMPQHSEHMDSPLLKLSKKSRSSGTRSETITNSSDEEFETCSWVDVQSKDPSTIQSLLELFQLHPTTVDNVLHPETHDTVERYQSLGYFFINILCPVLMVSRKSMITLQPEAVTTVVLSCIVFCDLIVTIHEKPFFGLLEVVRSVQRRFGVKSGSRGHGLSSNAPNDDTRSELSRHQYAFPTIRVGWVVSNLISTIISFSVKDPAALLQQVNEMDEGAILTAMEGSVQQQRALLHQIASFRRTLFQQRSVVFTKEHLLVQLLVPSMRSTFLLRRTADVEVIKQVFNDVAQVAARFETAREALGSANANLVSALSMNQNLSTRATDYQIQMLGVITVVCIPPVWLSGTMGMNISVPFMAANGTSNLYTFYVILAIIALWFLAMWYALLSKKK